MESFERTKFRGPPSFDHWRLCWAVYETAMIMADAASLPVLTAYSLFIETMAKQFGHVCWAIVYQTENRFRREHMEHLQRQESDSLDQAIMAGGTTLFDPKKPRDRCFDIAGDQ